MNVEKANDRLIYKVGKLAICNKRSPVKNLLVGLLSCVTLFAACAGYSNIFVRKAPAAAVATTTDKVISELKTVGSSEIKGIDPHVLALALKARHKAQAMGVTQKSLMTIIDYSLPSTQRRMWVVDVAKRKVIYHTHVAHGSGSGGVKAQRFSDVPGSYQSSLGVFVTGKTYQGKHGLSLTLHGLEKGINGNAERRRIVVHAANYVNSTANKAEARVGRSWGCPALNTQIARPVIQAIKEGSLLFAYYPDDKWLKRSRFL